MKPSVSPTLTTDLVMDCAGVYELMGLKELILRDMDLAQIDGSCAQSLTSLEILSLSHNRLTSLEYFQNFVNLIELNVNFNQIQTLDNLQCPGLEKLFIAHNQISDISPLRKLLKIKTLSLYGNRINDLDSALHTCRGLPKLRSLDLGGNPCSCDVEGYKFRVVRALSRLKALDGEHITQLDKDLTVEYFASMCKGSKKQIQNTAFIGCRPFTAPATTGAPKSPAVTRPESITLNGIDPFANSLMPRGNIRLFRDDFLNSNPILLEYMAQNAGGTASVDVKTNSSQNYSNDNGGSTSGTSSFVDKMRSANPLPKSDLESSDFDDVTSTATDDIQKLRLSPGISTSHLGVDPSDPNVTIRKLLKHIEVLMESLDRDKNNQLGTANESLLEENRQLQIEISNIPILQKQIHDLKKELAKLESDSSGTKVFETKDVESLKDQNASLQRENTRLKELLHCKLQPTEESAVVKSPEISSDEDERRQNERYPTRLLHSDLLDESALIDVELTELILQNEVSLELIRNDIKNTKKEWEEQFQHVKAAEAALGRPQTSPGLISTTRKRSSIDDYLLAEVKSNVQERQLHTSAGFRNEAGQWRYETKPPLRDGDQRLVV